uniref:Integrase catalytic domain-containing protein n=1 Tax=Tanacetum cinerariifolium TaxID=118510 RepID=A0A6L2NLS8_TANCI|nr:hypothetical protein [Tanacetum cinerariifolium]
MIQVRLNATVENICTDNGTKFVNHTLRSYYEDVGISHEISVVCTSQQNGVVERRNRTLVEAARTIKTPYELLHDRTPDLSYLYVFGALCYPTNDNEDLGKVKAKADVGIFIGYAHAKKAYWIYNQRTRRIMEIIHFRTRAITPSSTPFVSPTRNDWDTLLLPMFDEYFHPSSCVDNPVPKVAAPVPIISSGSPSSTSVDQDAPSPNTSQTPQESHPMLFLLVLKKQIMILKFYTWIIIPNLELVPRPDRVMIITLKWIYKVKLDELAAIRIFLAFAAHISVVIYQMDVKTAFLNGVLREEKFSKGTVDPTLFIKRGNKYILLVQIYVDDIIFTSIKPDLCEKCSEIMCLKFNMSMMGKILFFLRLHISQSPRGTFLNQSKYALEIIKKTGMETSDPVDTPMVVKSKLDADPQGKEVDPTRYHGMIGSIMYLTEVDQTFNLLYAYVDHAGCQNTKRSTSGSMQLLGDRLFWYTVKKVKDTESYGFLLDNKKKMKKGRCENTPYPRLKFVRIDKDYQEYGLAILETMLTDRIKQSESYQIIVVKKKVTITVDDKIFLEPDVALELGKSISLTKATEEEAARQVHATHARIMTEPIPKPAGRRPLADTMKALKESKKTNRRHPGTRGLSEGTGVSPGVPDKSTVVFATSNDGTSTKPWVLYEEKVTFKDKVILEWGSEQEKKKDDDDDKSINLEQTDNEETDDEFIHGEEHEQDNDEEKNDEYVHGNEQVNDDKDEEMTNADVEESGNDDEDITNAAKPALKLSKIQTPATNLKLESEKSALEIRKIKKEQAKKPNTMNKNKYLNKNPANHALYHALIEALIEDDNTMDKVVIDTVKNHKRQHNDDENPSAGLNQGKKIKRRRTKESESFMKPSTTKETLKSKAQSKSSKTDKSVTAQEPIKEPLAEADELYKFLNGTLKTVCDELHHRILDFLLGYNKEMSRRKWTATDKRRSELMVKLINKQMCEKRIIKNFERLVGAQELEMYYRLMTRTNGSSEYSIQVSEKYPIAITPVLPTENLDNSLSMGDEHLNTIPKTESEEVIKSMRTLSQSQVRLRVFLTIDSLLEEFVGKLAHIDPIPSRINETDYDPKDDIRFIEQLLYDDTSSEDDSFEDIDYVEASPPDSELASLKEATDEILHAKLLNIHLLIDKIDNHTKKTSSGSTTTHADNSPLEYDSFLFEIEPDQGELSSVAMESILGEPHVYVPNVLATYPTLYQDLDFSSSDDSIGSGLEFFSFRN